MDEQTLRQSYSEKPEEELRDLHALGTLTDIAYDILEAEIRKRGLPVPSRPEPEISTTEELGTSVLSQVANDGRTWLWVIATTVGWVIGMTIVSVLMEGFFDVRDTARLRIPVGVILFNPTATIVGIAALGGSLSIVQWLVLRPQISGAAWWIPATFVGWLVGFFLAVDGVPEHARVVLFSLTVGAAQWLVLRCQLSAAGWWVVATIVAVLVSEQANYLISGVTLVSDTDLVPSWTLTESLARYLLPWTVQGIVLGGITAVTFGYLRRKTAQLPNS